MYLRYAKYALLALSLSLVFFSMAQAQNIDNSGISVEVAPANYGANEQVNISLSSYSVNLDTVSISWAVAGKSVASGIGRKSISAAAPAEGVQTTVVATINLPEGAVQKTIYLKPNRMVILWEALDSHVPPFYRGKAMPSADSEIKVVAMPEIKAGSAILDQKSLVYAWRKDYGNEAEGSGYGKNSFTYINDYLENSNNIEVTASTQSGSQSSTAGINISASIPEISFYKKDARLGTIWDNALGNGYRVKNGETIVAVPYFISPKDIRRPDLVFSWFINGAPVALPNYSKTAIPLGIQEGTSGTSNLRLLIENSYKIFQSAEKDINLSF